MRSTVKLFAMSATVAASAVAGLTSQAMASDITFAVIGPHEYELPVNYEPFNALVQYGEINDNSRVWNESGHTQAGTGGALYEGLTKYVYFFDFKAIPNVGFAGEIIEPEVNVSDSSPHVGGLGGTIFGFAVWTKFNKYSTFGFQSFGQAPDATGRLTTGQNWNNLSSFLFDYQFKYVSFTGDLGMVFRGDERINNVLAHKRSDVFHFNGRWGLKIHPIVEPFLAVDWTSASSDHDEYTGQEVADSGFRETALGGGVNIQISKTFGFAVRYSHGVDGHNTGVTNAAYIKIAYIF
jgi:hypothetical protein